MTRPTMQMSRWQVALILGMCLMGSSFALPSGLTEGARAAVTQVAVQDDAAAIVDAVRKELRGAKIRYERLRVLPSGDEVGVRIVESAAFSDAVAVLTKLFETASPVPGKAYAVVAGDGGDITIKPAR